MTNARRLDLTVFRRDPMRLSLAAIGQNLEGCNPSFTVRLYPEQPGAALLGFGSTSTPGAEGIRIVDVIRDADSIPTTLFEIIALKASIQGLPFNGEIGAPTTLFYDLQWTPPPEGSGFSAVEQTVLFGNLIILGSAND